MVWLLLLIARTDAQAWREDRTLVAAADVIGDALDQRFVDSVPLNMERAWAESSLRVPIICLLSPGQGFYRVQHVFCNACFVCRAYMSDHKEDIKKGVWEGLKMDQLILLGTHIFCSQLSPGCCSQLRKFFWSNGLANGYARASKVSDHR